MKTLILTFFFSVLWGYNANAKAAYLGKTQMINRATNVVEVDITEVKDLKGEHAFAAGPNQTVKAQVKTNIKGKLEGIITILNIQNKCSYLCLGKAKYILFLEKRKDKFYIVNSHIGARFIKDGKVTWFKSEYVMRQGHKPVLMPIKEVIADIKKIIILSQIIL